MPNIIFSLFISKGVENMLGLKKTQWVVVGVTVVVVLVVMSAIANVDALEKPRKALGLDKGLI